MIDQNIKIGEVIVHEADPIRDNFIRSGFKVVEILQNGLKVRRIHAHYLSNEPNEPIESFILRWDQLKNFVTLPEMTQMPLL